MTKNEILLKLGDMVQRVKSVHRVDAQFGWDLLEIDKELRKVETDLAEQVDTFMANQYRLYTSAEKRSERNADITSLPRRQPGDTHFGGSRVRPAVRSQ